MRWIRSIVVTGVVVGVLVGVSSCGYEPTAADGAPELPSTTVDRGTATTVGASTPGDVPTSAPTTVTTSPPSSTVAPAARVPDPSSPGVATDASRAGGSGGAGGTPTAAVRVVDVIDGDTIKVEGGLRVRLIGIDTPERGQCGYTEAAFVLASVIRERPVVLLPGARTDTDHYGRLLRYVEVDGVDANLEMIRSGRAIARYDSRDGYGRHPREDLYVATDAATPSTNNCTPPPGGDQRAGSTGSTGGTDPRFGTCKEAKAAGYGGYVRGVDPEYEWYRDGDGDGIACE